MENPIEEETSSSFWFPLRTNVSYFADRSNYLTLQSRVKEALILFDKVLFQGGDYKLYVGEKNHIEIYMPYGEPHEEGVKFTERSKGAPFSLAFRPSTAKPKDPDLVLVDDTIWVEYGSQYHNLYKELISFGIEDIDLIDIDLNSEGKKIANELAEIDLARIALYEMNELLGRRLVINLNHDLILQSELRLPSSIDGIHASLLTKKLANMMKFFRVPGFIALDTCVPNFSSLHWDHIAELRHDPSIHEFRREISGIEKGIVDSLGKASEADVRQLINEHLTDELLLEIKNLRPTKGKILGDISIDLMACLVPPVGYFKSTFDAVGEMVDLYKSSRSWITMLMKLRGLP